MWHCVTKLLTQALCNGTTALFLFYFHSYCFLKHVWAAVIEYHRLGVLNDRNAFLIILEAERSRIKVLTDSTPWQDVYS